MHQGGRGGFQTSPDLQPTFFRETDGNSGHETQSHGNRYSHKASALVKEHSPSKQDSLTRAGIKACGGNPKSPWLHLHQTGYWNTVG